MLSVGEHKHRALDARQELFNHHATGSIAKLTAEHFSQCFLSFFERGKDEHPLTSAETVGLQDIGGRECCKKIATSFHLCAIEGLISCGGNAVTLHKGFGKVF